MLFSDGEEVVGQDFRGEDWYAERLGRVTFRDCTFTDVDLTEAITRMEQSLEWLRWLEGDDAKLVWARSEGMPWKQICCRFGIARATADRRWRYALALIAFRLNGQTIPSKRSRAFVVDRARAASSAM